METSVGVGGDENDDHHTSFVQDLGTHDQGPAHITADGTSHGSDSFVCTTQSCKIGKGLASSQNVCGLAQSCWRRSKNKSDSDRVTDGDDDANLKLTLQQPHSKRSSVSYNDFAGLDDDKSQRMCPMQSYKLGKIYNLSPQQIADARRTFDKYDFDGNGTLDPDEFKELIASFCVEQFHKTWGLDSGLELPQDLFKGIDESTDGLVDFEEFLRWISMQSFREDMMIPVSQQQIRTTARKFDLPFPEVEAVKCKFDHFDSSSNGTIDREEFKQLLKILLKTKGAELPANRVQAFWREIDVNANGVVEFEEFLPWYIRYFPLDGGVAASPIESFYASARLSVHFDGPVFGDHSINRKL